MNYKLSPSDLTYLYEGCKFCFWLKVKQGIAQPSMPMPGIFSTIAGLQKGFYAEKRTEDFCKELPPGVVHLGEEWVESKPISFQGLSDQCYIKGRFDVVVKFDDGSFGVIDFKTARSSEEKAEMYSRQLQAYTFALENAANGRHSLLPVKKIGLFFFEPNCFEQPDLTCQLFKGHLKWIEVKRDDTKFMKFLEEVMRLLVSETPPQPAADCNWCSYREKTKDLNAGEQPGNTAATTSPPCPQCNSPMTLKKGKFGEFWSCNRFPECRGTRKK